MVEKVANARILEFPTVGAVGEPGPGSAVGSAHPVVSNPSRRRAASGNLTSMKIERDKSAAIVAANGTGLSEEEIEHLFACHHEGLVGYFMRRGIPKEEARELAQEVWQAACAGQTS